MTASLIAPPTFGQLSVWRSIENYAPDEEHNANLLWNWPLPAGHTTAEVNRALTALAERHTSLRTGYRRSGERGIEQVLREAAPVVAEEAELPADPEATAAWLSETGARLTARRFDLAEEAPWRPVVATRDGRPEHMLLCIHHMAADGAAIDLIRAELLLLLEGKDLGEPAPDCRQLALEQQTEAWQARSEAAVRHWRDTVADGPGAHVLPVGRTTLCRGTLNSSPALAAALAAADALEVSLQAVTLTAFVRTLAARTGERDFVIGLFAGNRFDERSRRLVSSLNQLTPLRARTEPGESFADCAHRLQWGALRAYRHGAFDVDALAEVRESYGYDAKGLGFKYCFNFMEGNREEAPAEPDPQHWSISMHTQGKDNGLPFYFNVGHSHDLWCLLRASSEETGEEGETRLEAETRGFLTAFHEELLRLNAPAAVAR